MIYLDTHVVAWLYGGQIESLSLRARNLINENDLYISPIVLLELQYLLEIERITQSPQTVTSSLSTSIGLRVCDKDFQKTILCAGHFSWTRDPFDRIIVAHAALDNNRLLTKDRTILTHFEHAVW